MTITDKLADALIQILDDGGHIKNYDENEQLIFVEKHEIKSGAYCGLSAMNAIKALKEYEASKTATDDLMNTVTQILNEARCLSKRTVGNRELAQRVVTSLLNKGE